MKQPWVYMCSPSRSPLPPPSPPDPSGPSQCTSPEHLSLASTLNWRSVGSTDLEGCVSGKFPRSYVAGIQGKLTLKYRNSLWDYFKSSGITSRSESWYSTGSRNEIERKKRKWETLIEKQSMELGKGWMGFPGGSVVKDPPANAGEEMQVPPWVRKIPWRRVRQPTPVFLPGESCGQRSLEGYSPWGRRSPTVTTAVVLEKMVHRWFYLQPRLRTTNRSSFDLFFSSFNLFVFT